MFITFEGIEGVGKSTLVSFLAAELEQRGSNVVVTREPGGTQMGEELRDVLLAHRNEVVNPKTELLLMFANRAQHITTLIQPALDRGDIVICDRFTDASYAYQGGGRGVDENDIATLEKLVQGDLQPDHTFILDADVTVGLSRAGRRRGQDRIEVEKQEFFQRVRQAYLRRAEQNPQRYHIIDASQSLAQVKQQLLDVCQQCKI